MNDRDLLVGEYAVLGLLALRPMHGYEMSRSFDPAGLGAVCPIDHSLLYAYLRNVEERRLVNWREARVGNRPPRKTYALTDDGRATLDAWLRAPVDRMREVRRDLLLKLYFLHRLDPDGERALLARQIDVCEQYQRRLKERLPATEDFERLVMHSKLSAAEGTATWLRQYALEIDAVAV
jgi:DNA-binding PadR family transcriptional regulator